MINYITISYVTIEPKTLGFLYWKEPTPETHEASKGDSGIIVKKVRKAGVETAVAEMPEAAALVTIRTHGGVSCQ